MDDKPKEKESWFSNALYNTACDHIITNYNSVLNATIRTMQSMMEENKIKVKPGILQAMAIANLSVGYLLGSNELQKLLKKANEQPKITVDKAEPKRSPKSK